MAFQSDVIKRVRRNPWWLLLGGTPWILGLLLAVGALAVRNPALLTPEFHLAIFGAMGFFYAYRRNKDPRVDSGRLIVDEQAVRFGDALLCRRDEIKSGLVVPREGHVYVRLERKGLAPSVLLEVDNEQEGQKLLTALGLDASQTVAELRALSPYFEMPGWKQLLMSFTPALLGGFAVAWSAALGRAAAPFGVVGFILTTLLFVAGILWPSRLSIGADGILSRWLWRRRFFPFSQLERVDPVERGALNKRYLGLELSKKDGTTTFLPIGQKRWAEEEFNAAAERVREAIAVYGAGGRSRATSALARAGRSPSEWITSLRRLGEGANADMRTAPVAREELARVVADPSAGPAVRASAAVALAASKAPADLARIRVAAEAAAAPKLRVALMRATDAEAKEEELAADLAELEAEEAAEKQARVVPVPSEGKA